MSLTYFLGHMEEWMDKWMGGWMDGWMGVRCSVARRFRACDVCFQRIRTGNVRFRCQSQHFIDDSLDSDRSFASTEMKGCTVHHAADMWQKPVGPGIYCCRMSSWQANSRSHQRKRPPKSKVWKRSALPERREALSVKETCFQSSAS